MNKHKIDLGRRGPVEIVYNILYYIHHSNGEGLSKTHIMYLCNLNWRQLENYLVHLDDRELIRKVNIEKSEKYLLTSKGIDVLNRFNELLELLAVKNTSIE